MRLRPALVALALAVTSIVAVAPIPTTLACYCMPPDSLTADVGADTAVVVGQVGPAEADGRQVLTVERWFHGGQPQAVLELHPAGGVLTSCDQVFVPGARLVIAAPRQGDRLAAFLCSPVAEVDSPRGRAWIAEAEREFGSGIATGDMTAEHAAVPADAGPWLLGGAGLGLAALLAAAVIVDRRSRRAP